LKTWFWSIALHYCLWSMMMLFAIIFVPKVLIYKEAVIDIITIAILLSIVSSITGLFFITKYEPKQILANRT